MSLWNIYSLAIYRETYDVMWRNQPVHFCIVSEVCKYSHLFLNNLFWWLAVPSIEPPPPPPPPPYSIYASGNWVNIGSGNGLLSVGLHYLYQYCIVVSRTRGNNLQWNLNRNKIFSLKNAFETVVCEITAVLSRVRYVYPFPGTKAGPFRKKLGHNTMVIASDVSSRQLLTLSVK